MKWQAMALVVLCSRAAHADAPVLLAGDHRAVLPARATGRIGDAALFALAAPIPAQPWASIRVRLSSLLSGTPLALADGSVEVGLQSHAVLHLARDGSIVHETSLGTGSTDRPARIARAADGALFVLTLNHALLLLPPDHTVRAIPVNATPMIPLEGPFTRADGSVVLVGSAEIQVYSPGGALVARQQLPGTLLVHGAAQSGDGCVWVAMRDLGSGSRDAGSVACFADDDTLRPSIAIGTLVSAQGGVTGVAGGGVVVVTAADVQLRANDGTLRGRLDTTGVGSPHIAPQPNGGVAFFRDQEPQRELVVMGRDGTVTLRWPVPGDEPVTAVLGDATGAMLVLTANGVLTAIEPDGAVRWTTAPIGAIRRDLQVIPLATGGVAIPLDSGGLVLLE